MKAQILNDTKDFDKTTCSYQKDFGKTTYFRQKDFGKTYFLCNFAPIKH